MNENRNGLELMNISYFIKSRTLQSSRPLNIKTLKNLSKVCELTSEKKETQSAVTPRLDLFLGMAKNDSWTFLRLGERQRLSRIGMRGSQYFQEEKY